jgi:small-conductance mechanosensitive channel
MNPTTVLAGMVARNGTLVAQAPNPEKVVEIARKLEIFSFWKLAVAVVVVILGFLTSRLVRMALDRLGEGNARRRLFLKKVTSFARIGIFAITVYLVVMVFFDAQEDKTALLGLGGTLAVALGFALKDVSSSLMAGILLAMDQPFQVGDRVKFRDTYGEVTELGLRAVRIVTLDDDEVSIPNSEFLTEPVASANAGSLDMMVVMDFHIAVTEDFELAKRLIYEACTTSKYVFLEKPVRVEVSEEVEEATFTTQLRCKAYVIDTRYEKAFITDVTERVKRAFRKYRIKHPYQRRFSLNDPERDEYLDVSRRASDKLRSPDATSPEVIP